MGRSTHTRSRDLAAKQLRIVGRLAQAIIRRQDPGFVMQRLAEELVGFGFTIAIVTELDERVGGFRVLGVAPQSRVVRLASSILNIRLDRFVLPFQPNANKVLDRLGRGKPWIGDDVGEIVKPVLSPRLARQIQKLLGMRALYSGPLMAGKRIVGSVFVGVMRETFTARELSFLKTITGHAALIVEQARMVSENKRRTEQYRLLGKVDRQILEEKELSNVLAAVVKNIGSVIPCDLSAIYLADHKRKVFTPAVSSSNGPLSAKLRTFEVPFGKGILGWAARRKKAVIVNNSHSDPRSVYPDDWRPSLEHLLCVPLLAGSSVLGVLCIGRFHEERFTDGDLEVAKQFGEKSTLAVENARLLHAVSDSERKFRRLFEESKDAIYISTPAGRMVDVNQAAVTLFGFRSKAEMQNIDIAQDLYVNPEDRRKLLRNLEKGGFVKDVELRLKKKDGTRMLVLATISVIRDESGYTIAYQGILRDVTEQKEAERKLHESEQKYRSLVEDSLVGVYILQEGTFAFVNRRFAEIFGYKVGDLVNGKISPAMLVVPGGRAEGWSSIEQNSELARSLKWSFRGLRKDGEILEIEAFATASVYAGRPAIIGTVFDRTQERRQQKEISDWRRRYELTIASSGQIVYEYNVRTGKILWGGSIEKVLGYSLDELRGDIAEWEDLIHPEDRDEAIKALDRSMQIMAPYDVEYRYRKKDGSYAWIHDRGFFVGEGGTTELMLGMMEDITRHKDLEERVRSSELKHRLLFEHANDGVLVLRGEMIIDCNPRAMELFGGSKEDLLGQTLYAFSPPHQLDGTESKSGLLQRIEAALHTGPQQFTWRHVRRDGSLFEGEVRLNRFELGSDVLVQAQIRDVTSELEAVEELARSEEKYRKLVLEAGDAILVMDGNGSIVEANEKACGMLQITRTEILGMTVAAFSPLPPEEALAEYRRLYSHLIEKGHITTGGNVLKRRDGTIFPYEMSAVLLGNGLLQSIIRDVSEKKKAEQEVDQIYALATTHHGKELFEKAASGLAELLGVEYVVVAEGVDQGRRMRSLTFFENGTFGSEQECDVKGSVCEEVVNSRKTSTCSSDAANLFPRDESLRKWKVQSVICSPMVDSNQWVIGIVAAMSTRPHKFSDHEKKIMSIIVQRLASELDMMAQRKREDHLSRQLLQSQKMESLGTLAGGVAHDFNNILGAVIGYTSLIKRQTDPESQIGRYLAAIEKSAQRAASLSKQLLSFSHKTQGDIQPVVMNDLIRDTIHIISSSFPKWISVNTVLADSLPPVLGDQNQLGQVVMNLCINARDAIEENREAISDGTLTITTSAFDAEAGFVDVHLSAAPGKYVCISVEDNGIGMKEEVRQRIFEPFFTTKGKGRGTGLGLAMVYGIVRNHGGVIDVYSEPKKGTKIKIFLPAAETAEAREEAALEESLPHGNGQTVMIVDDEPMLRELVADVLTGQGYHVLPAANGKEAVELYQREQARIRLVILDMIMPEMDGQATFNALKSLNPELKVLISSGFSQDSSVQVLLNSGAAGFVAKPYQTEDLLRAVAQHLQ